MAYDLNAAALSEAENPPGGLKLTGTNLTAGSSHLSEAENPPGGLKRLQADQLGLIALPFELSEAENPPGGLKLLIFHDVSHRRLLSEAENPPGGLKRGLQDAIGWLHMLLAKPKIRPAD